MLKELRNCEMQHIKKKGIQNVKVVVKIPWELKQIVCLFFYLLISSITRVIDVCLATSCIPLSSGPCSQGIQSENRNEAGRE